MTYIFPIFAIVTEWFVTTRTTKDVICRFPLSREFVFEIFIVLQSSRTEYFLNSCLVSSLARDAATSSELLRLFPSSRESGRADVTSYETRAVSCRVFEVITVSKNVQSESLVSCTRQYVSSIQSEEMSWSERSSVRNCRSLPTCTDYRPLLDTGSSWLILWRTASLLHFYQYPSST